MAFEPIRQHIKTKLEGIAQIQAVYDYPEADYSGFPVALLVTNRNEAEFETTVHNKRIYIFALYIIQDFTEVGMKKARRTVEGVVDVVLDNFANDQQLSGISLPGSEILIISQPLLSEIRTDDDAKYVIAEMEIKVVTQYQIT